MFLAGGIGITPFREHCVPSSKGEAPHRTFFLTRIGAPRMCLSSKSFKRWKRRIRTIRLIASMTEMKKSHQPWHGETGLVNTDMLARYLKDAARPIYYIAGPPAMVKGLHEMLNKAGMKDDDIRAEEIEGY